MSEIQEDINDQQETEEIDDVLKMCEAISFIAESKQIQKLEEKFEKEFPELYFGEILCAFCAADAMLGLGYSAGQTASTFGKAVELGELYSEIVSSELSEEVEE